MRVKDSKSYMFLMELIFVILIFSICSSICLKVFTSAKIMSDKADDINNASVIAGNCAECYKAYDGKLSKVAQELNGIMMDGSLFFQDKEYDTYVIGDNRKVNIYVVRNGEKDYKQNSILDMEVKSGVNTRE